MNQLKEAERKATQLVQDARNARQQRMKEAKSEAEQIIAAFRSEQEASYQQALSKISNKSGQSNNELQTQTNNDIATMSREFSTRKEAVQKMLIDFVIDVEIKAPAAKH